MILEVLFASLIAGLVFSAVDNFGALIYVVIGSRASSMYDWWVLTIAFIVFFLVRQLLKHVRG